MNRRSNLPPGWALWVAAVVALALVGGAMAVAGRTGRAARRIGPVFEIGAVGLPVRVVDDSAGVLRHWRERGVRGRIVVYASRFLHFVPPSEESEVPILAAWRRPWRAAAAPIDHRDLLWAAMRDDIGREFVHLVPPAVLRDKAGGMGRAAEAPIRTSELGTPRTVRADLPRFDEPVLVGVDAALFAGADAAAVLEALRTRALRTDDVVLSLARDNPAVHDTERQALLAWAGVALTGEVAP